jgi:hypothetical protein
MFITESGMKFGPYNNDQCFDIEHSRLYASISNAGVKTAEFLVLKNEQSNCPQILEVVEAKSSTPSPGGKENFDDFISQIRDKFVNALTLCLATCLNRHPKFHGELPGLIQKMDLSQIQVRFVLVIQGHREDWLQPIDDSLNKAMRSTLKIWGFSHKAVVVLNDDMAKERQYIV